MVRDMGKQNGIWRRVSLKDRRRKQEEMDCKKQAMAGVCVYWVKTRYLVVVRIQKTTRAAGRILIGRYVLVVPADGGKQD